MHTEYFLLGETTTVFMVGGAKALIFFLTLSAKQGNVVLLPENTDMSIAHFVIRKSCNTFKTAFPPIQQGSQPVLDDYMFAVTAK